MDLRSLLLSVSLCAATYGVGQAQRLQTNSSDTSVSTVVRMDIQQNKVNYAPGEAVRFTLEGTLPDGAHVRYRYGNTIIGDETLSCPQWTWTPPKDDYRGYLVELYTNPPSLPQQPWMCRVIGDDSHVMGSCQTMTKARQRT